MDKQSPTFEETSSYVMEVKRKLLPCPHVYKQFQQTLLNFIQGRISPEFAVSSVNFLFKNEPELLLGFQKFVPIHLQTPLQIGTQNQEPNVQKSEGNSKKVTRTKLKNGIKYVNRVLKGLEDHPGMVLKFFELMKNYENDSNEAKLKQSLFSLFKLYPEYEIEFTQFITEGSLPRPRFEGDFRVRAIEENSLEFILNSLEDEMFENDMLISGIRSAIRNTMRLLDTCWENPETVQVRSCLTSKNLEDVSKYCKVDLEMSSNIQESAYAVVGKLRHQLELTRKKNGNAIRAKRDEKLERFRQRTRMD